MKNAFFLILSGLALRSTAQWTSVVSNTIEQLNAMHFISDSIGFVVGNNGIILKTQNCGTSFTPVFDYPLLSLNSITSLGKDTIVTVGTKFEKSFIIKSFNGGSNWSIDSSLPPDFYINNIRSDRNNMFFVGVSSPANSIWSLYKYNTQNYLEILDSVNLYDIKDNVGFALFRKGGDAKVFKTTDGGASWLSILNNLNSLGALTPNSFNWTSFRIVNDTTVIGNVSYPNYIIYSRSNGSTWGAYNLASARLFFVTPAVVYNIAPPDSIAISRDSGATWATHSIGHALSQVDDVIYFANFNLGFIFGKNGRILRTTDGGGLCFGAKLPLQKKSIAVFPNPAQTSLHIKGLSGRAELVLISNDGRVMQSAISSSVEFILDVSNLPTGIYFLNVNCLGSCESSTTKFLKKNR